MFDWFVFTKGRSRMSTYLRWCVSRILSRVVVAAATAISLVAPQAASAAFVRSDSNGDGRVDISDVSFATNYVFVGTASPASLDAADANDDGSIDISDVLFTYHYLLLGGPQPPAPFPAPGIDPTEDNLPLGPDQSAVIPPPAGSSLDFSFGPSMISAVQGNPFQFEVEVILELQDLVSGVEAWSFGTQLTGGSGSIVSATVAGTDAAAGVFTGVEVIPSGVVTAVVMPVNQPIMPPVQESTVLKLTLEGTGPAAGTSETWILSFSNTLQGSGQRVEAIVSSTGLSFAPTLGQLTIEVQGIVPEPNTLTLTALALLTLTYRRPRRPRSSHASHVAHECA